MFFILSKIFHFLISPLSWILGFFIAGILFKKKKSLCFAFGIFLLFLFSNPFLINYITRAWEIPSKNINSITVPYEAGIVLGGAMRYYNSTMERPVYGSAADRVMQAIELYKSGKIKKIILSGGSGLVTMQEPKESVILKNLLLKMDIPNEDILVEQDSRNTYENTIYTLKLIKAKNITGEFLLITSAFHMRRSLGCFKKAGFTVTPYPVDERSGKITLTPDKLFIPEAENLETWDLLMHEWVGYISYWIAGYL